LIAGKIHVDLVASVIQAIHPMTMAMDHRADHFATEQLMHNGSHGSAMAATWRGIGKSFRSRVAAKCRIQPAAQLM
jgi:hypothetical protein